MMAAGLASANQKSFISALTTAMKSKLEKTPELPPLFVDAQVYNDLIDCAFAGKDAHIARFGVPQRGHRSIQAADQIGGSSA